MTITEFLEARIAEDERLALAASDGPWRAVDGCDVRDGSGRSLMDYADLRAADAEHIARRDPSRVLAECAAKRAIIGLHDYEWMGPDDAAGKGCVHDYEDWPCPTIRILAAIYADHPDYRQEWAA